MDASLVPDLADGLKEYFSESDLAEHCDLFDLHASLDGTHTSYFRLARRLVLEIEHGSNRRCLETLVRTLVSRARERMAHTQYERREHHTAMLHRLLPLESALRENPVPAEISIPEQKPFTAKSALRDFIGQADTPILIVDNYIGPGTLDCLRDVKSPIRLLTGSADQSIAAGFERALEEFRAEGFQIEIRRHPKLHDRYVCFGNRVWLVGSSLKDAGKKSLNVIECVDGRVPIQTEVETKWVAAAPYP
jgi:hypothetical protein